MPPRMPRSSAWRPAGSWRATRRRCRPSRSPWTSPPPAAASPTPAARGPGSPGSSRTRRATSTSRRVIQLDTSKAILQLTTTGTAAAGGPFDGDNSLVNALQTQFDATKGAFTISTRLVGPLGYLNAPSEQGGLLFGPDQDNYVKLAVGDFANGQGLQFIDEQKPAGATTYTHTVSSANSFTGIGSLANVKTLDLELSGDPSSGTVTGYYRINGGAPQALPQSVTLSGAEKSAFFGTTSRAGILAMAKNDQAPVTLSFGKFAVDTGSAASQLPAVISSTPAPGASKVRRDAYISCDLRLPNSGLDAKTVNSTTVYLYRASDGSRVSAVVNTTGGGDAIVLTPNTALDASTKYTFVASNGVKDLGGASLVPYQMSFTTGTDGGPVQSTLAFQKVTLPTAAGVPFTCVRVGPDHKLYASTQTGEIYRFAINTDGTLAAPDIINSLKTANGTNRLISGFAFDPTSTPTDVKLWVDHGDPAVFNAADFSGKITLLTGANLQNVLDAVVHLPRASRDHLTEQPVFGPDGALYLCQGSNTAFGAAGRRLGQPPRAPAQRGHPAAGRHQGHARQAARREDRFRRHLQPVRRRRAADDLRHRRAQHVQPRLDAGRAPVRPQQRLGRGRQLAGVQLVRPQAGQRQPRRHRPALRRPGRAGADEHRRGRGRLRLRHRPRRVLRPPQPLPR